MEQARFGKVVTASVAKQIAADIRQSILEGRIRADERLPTEEELARHFRVSRPTIREALKRLAAENLICSRRGPTGGNFVKKPTREEVIQSVANLMTLMVTLGDFDLEEISHARLQLELACCDLAARHREEAHLERMREEIAVQKNSGTDDVAFCASDVRFHLELVKAAGSPILDILVEATIQGLQPATNLVVFRFRDRRRIVSQHERIVVALERRNGHEASAVLAEQMAYLREKYNEAQQWRERRDNAKAVRRLRG